MEGAGAGFQEAVGPGAGRRRNVKRSRVNGVEDLRIKDTGTARTRTNEEEDDEDDD